MHDLSAELRSLTPADSAKAAVDQALAIEQRQILSVRPELLVALYAAVATLVAGVGLLIKTNLDRIGPLALLTGIFTAAAICHGLAWRARHADRERTLAEDYVLLLGALLFSTAIGYAEAEFRLFGAGWSRHLLLLAVWHAGSAYWFRSRLVLAIALAAFAAWVGVEARLGTIIDPLYPRFGGIGTRALVCALVFWLGSRAHWRHDRESADGFREVYRQFAVNFAFVGALALGGDEPTRWIGVIVLLILAVLVGMAGLAERRQSFLLYAVGYTTIGLVWLEALVIRDYQLQSWVGFLTVIAAVMLLLRLRARLKESTP